MRALFAAAALALSWLRRALRTTTSFRNSPTKRCRIVEERPSPGIGVQIGPVGFGVRTEAESRMRTVEECRESGATTGGGGVRIEERERVIRER